MKNKFKMQIAAQVFFTAVLLIAITVFAAQPGSSEDPLASKSYVDNKINELMNTLNNGSNLSINNNSTNNNSQTAAQGITEAQKQQIIDDIMKQVEPLIALTIEKDSNENTAGATTNIANPLQISGLYTPVYASTGQVVLGSDGTEMILRSGKAKAYVTGAAGIVNATAGTELKNDSKVNLNNIIIIPRGDGRGVKVTENAWFMIKGEYTVSE